MPQERNYYVICEDNCKFPSMTKEQIVAAIEEATGYTPSEEDLDQAFITKIKEMNKNSQLKWWVGTEAEYNALTDVDDDCLYILTDTSDDVETMVILLQQQVERIQATYKPVRQKAVVITDSYGDATITGTNSLISLIPQLKSFGVEISQHYVKPGAGFNADTGEYAFRTYLETFTSDDTVTEVVVIGGYNDVNNGTSEGIITNAGKFCESAKNKFPNAKVRAYFVGKQRFNQDGTWRINYYKALQAWKNGFLRYNAEVVEGSPYILTSAEDFMSDNFHPNLAGVTMLARYIATSIKTGSPVNVERSKECTISPATSVTNIDTGITNATTGKQVCYQYVCNAISRTWFKKLHIDFNGVSATMDGTPVTIGTIDSPIASGSQYGDFKAVVPAGVFIGGSFINTTAVISIAGNAILLSMYAINSAGSGKVSGTMTAFETLMPFQLECPTIHVMN